MRYRTGFLAASVALAAAACASPAAPSAAPATVDLGFADTASDDVVVLFAGTGERAPLRYELAEGSTTVAVAATDHIEIQYNSDAPIVGEAPRTDSYEFAVAGSTATSTPISLRRASRSEPVSLTIDDRGRVSGNTWPDIAVHVIPTVQLLLDDLVVQGPILALPLPETDVAAGAEWATTRDIEVPWTTPRVETDYRLESRDGSDIAVSIHADVEIPETELTFQDEIVRFTGKFTITGEVDATLDRLGGSGELVVEGTLRISDNRGQRYEVDIVSTQTYT